MLRMRLLTLITAVTMTGCIAEWDYPRVPKQNPETCVWESEYVYWPVDRRRPRCVPPREQPKR